MKNTLKRWLQKLGLLELIQEFSKVIRNFFGIVTPRYLAFSQAGEDIILTFLFQEKKINLAEVSYLDIGACHPFSGNNSYFLYYSGSKGVLIEPTKNYENYFKKIRTRDLFLNICITPNEGESSVKLYYSGGGSGSTIDKLEAEKRVALGIKIEKIYEVPAKTINRVIDEHFDRYPVFLSIDIEGVDLSVLKSLDFERFKIPVILVETCVFSLTHVRPKDPEIFNFMQGKGYEVYADTYINTIFVKKDWFYKEASL